MTNGIILIVEDNDLNSLLMADILELNNYSSIRAHDGAEAIALVRSRRPDLIVMDIQLPEMSGIEVIRLLKQDDDLRSIPIIAVTAFAMPSEEEAIRAAGSDDYISKPIDILRFLKAVDRLLPRPSDSLVAHESK